MLETLDTNERRKRFYRLASEHKVRGTAYVALSRHPEAASLPPPVRQFLSRQLAQLRERCEAQDAELRDLLAKMRRAHLRPVVMKGASLRWTVYDTPIERWYGDFDILVPRDQVESALRVAVAAGYQVPPRQILDGYCRHHFHVLLPRSPIFRLELHWGLSPPWSEFQLDPGSFLSHTATFSLGDEQPYLCPSPELQLLHASSDSLRHCFDLLVKLVDMQRILKKHSDLDWDLVLREATRGGSAAVLWLSLRLLKNLLPGGVPNDVVERAKPNRLARLHANRLRPPTIFFEPNGLSKDQAQRLLQVWLNATPRAMWRELATLVSQDLDWIWLREPGPHGSVARRKRQAKRIVRIAVDQFRLYLHAALRR